MADDVDETVATDASGDASGETVPEDEDPAGSSTFFLQGGTTLFGNVFGKAIKFGFFLAATRLTTQSTFGVYTLAISIVMFSQSFSNINLNRAVDYFIPQHLADNDHDGANQVFWNVIGITVPSTVVVLGVVLLFSDRISALFGESALSAIMPYVALLVLLVALNRILFATFNSIKKMHYRVLTKNLTQPILMLGSVVVFLSLGFSLHGLMLAHLLGVLGSVLLGLWLLYRKVNWISWPTYNRDSISSLVSYSLPLAFAGVIYATVAQIDYFVIGYFHPAADVASYRVAYLLATNILIVHTAIKPIFKPMIAEKQHDGNARRERYQLIVRWVTMLTFPAVVTLLVLPGQYLSLFFSAKYAVAAPALVLLVVGQFLNISVGPSGRFIESIGRTRITFLNTVVLVSLNSILDFALVPTFGIVGAATATATSLTFLAVLTATEIRVFEGFVPVDRSLVKLWLSGLLTLISGYFIVQIVGRRIETALIAPVAVLALYFILLVVFDSFTAEDRRAVNQIDDRLGYKVFSRII
ncbi:oligosaccharide flippase family protein [Halorhabdus rudnickae]|uniref:oligosaccharide flippase family protein n=1 Tax=Halorhabdus rudnickae TaxID=1775544 RepID=UPI0010835438|nr:oligosaccharide flippase family protein [Halorhabdus rudnickae]